MLLRRACLLCVAWILSTYVFRLAHEVLGHLLCAAIFGGEIRGLWLFPGAAASSYRLPGDASTFARFVTGAAGIAVQLITGLAALALFRRTKRIAFLVYAAASLTAATSYGALGLYYEWGDPVGVVANIVGKGDAFWRTPLRERGWFVPFVVATALVTFAIARAYGAHVRARLREHAGVALLVVIGAVSFRQLEKLALPPWTAAMDSREHGARLAQRHGRTEPESPPPLLPMLVALQACAAGLALRKPHLHLPLEQAPLAHSLLRRHAEPEAPGSLHVSSFQLQRPSAHSRSRLHAAPIAPGAAQESVFQLHSSPSSHSESNEHFGADASLPASLASTESFASLPASMIDEALEPASF